MRSFIVLIVLALMLAGCDQVIFPEPQPKKEKPLTSIPLPLQGTFLDENGDSLYVYEDHFSYMNDDLVNFEDIYLSDSAVLKSYIGHYFLNIKIFIGDETYWLTYIIEPLPEDQGIDLYSMDPDDVVRLAKLQEVTSKVRDIEKGDQAYYLFDPKRRHYKKIISDTIFSKMISFERISP